MKNKHGLSENELMILVFASEFAMCFISIALGILPLYFLLGVCGFLFAIYKDKQHGNITKRN